MSSEVTLDLSWIELANLSGADWLPLIEPHLAQYPAFWECAPVSADLASTPVRFVVVYSEAVGDLEPDPSAFAEHLSGFGDAVAFWNLRRDSRLVAPPETGPYSHLQAFLQYADPHEKAELFEVVAAELRSWWQRTDDPVWLSTHGLGVSWLHVRLDARPKYYTHRPYRSWD